MTSKFLVLRGNHVDPISGGTFPADSVVDSDFNLDQMDPSKYRKLTEAQAKAKMDEKRKAMMSPQPPQQQEADESQQKGTNNSTTRKASKARK